jgi:uncharacterized YigZ family protein
VIMFDDTYKTIASKAEGIYKDRGSKFIALAFPVKSEEEVKEVLENVRKEYHDARHHCYAWILGHDKSAYRQNDDGEPSGTAGRPIHGQLLSFDLTNVLLVVVRYFGGTRLGVPGLIRAYKTAAKEALSAAGIVTMTVYDVYELHFEYPLLNEVMRLMKDEKLEVLEQDFRLYCRLIFQVRKNESNHVYDKAGKMKGVKIRYLYMV